MKFRIKKEVFADRTKHYIAQRKYWFLGWNDIGGFSNNWIDEKDGWSGKHFRTEIEAQLYIDEYIKLKDKAKKAKTKLLSETIFYKNENNISEDIKELQELIIKLKLEKAKEIAKNG